LAISQSNIYECAWDEKKKGKMFLWTVMKVLDKSEDAEVASGVKGKKNKVIAAVIAFQQAFANRLNCERERGKKSGW